METDSFSKKERDQLVSTIFQFRKKQVQLSIEIEDNSEDESVEKFLIKKLDKTLVQLEEIEDEYTQGLSRRTISRCPFSNEPFSLSIDTFGLDRPWWDVEQPIRAFEEETKTFFALTGSVTIIGEPPEAPFSIKPGPAIPWVSPRLLEDENIVAVLSHIKIENYDAYPIVYYSKDKSEEIERINTWGTDAYLAEDINSLAVIGSTYDDKEEYDFDIAPWIKKGKLKWISINDDSLELHDNLEECPYLDLKGYRHPVLLQNKILKDCMITLEYEEDENSNKENVDYNVTNYDIPDYKVPEINSPKKTINFCSNCGTPTKKGDKFCANCGNKLD